MDQFSGEALRPVMGIGRGRGRGRGQGPVNPEEEDGGQGQGPNQVGAVGRSRGIARGRLLEGITSEQGIIPEVTVADNQKLSSSTSSSRSTDEPTREGNGDPDSNELEKKKVEDQKKKADLEAQGFLDPLKISLSYLSDTIKRGEKRNCALYTMLNTNTIYLILSKHFSKAIDKFIKEMGEWYSYKKQQEQLLRNVREEELVAGAIVAVYHQAEDEWKRARIMGPFRDRSKGRGRIYKVLFLDLGDFAEVPPSDIFYLHESFVGKPVFAIRARLGLTPFYDGPLYRYNLEWERMVSVGVLKGVGSKKLMVKFIEQKEFQNENCWTVSMLSVKESSNAGLEGNREGRGSQEFSGTEPIEQQVIAKVTGGQYVK